MVGNLMDLLTPSEAARELEVSEARFNQMRRRGEVEVVPTRLGALVERSALDKLKAERAARLPRRQTVS